MKVLFLQLACFLVIVPVAIASSDPDPYFQKESDLESKAIKQWQLDQQKFALLEKEKMLLSAEDQLFQRVEKLKKVVKYSADEIEEAQKKLRGIKYELIDVQLRLVK